MQDSTRSRGFQPQGQGTDATQKDIPDDTQQEFQSPGDAETPRDYRGDRTEQDIRTQQTADYSGQKTDQDIGAGRKKVWADPFAQENTSDEGVLGFDRQNPAFDKTSKSGGADLVDTSGDTNWDALDKPKAGSSGSPSQSASRAPLPNPRKSPVGQTFANKYEIVGQIGQGGMGIVYKANDLILARTVAIKVIKANSQAKVEEISRFQLEAKSIAKLDHPNIIRVYEMNVTTDGDPYFVLEYIAGNSLSNEIRGRKGLPLDETIEIVEQVCDALNHAHESGVIHRDLKPSNIMLVKLRDRVVVKLLDFGIAKHFAVDEATLQLLQLTRPGQAFGSPHYMSPEQSRGQADSPASDIYSLGCMFFEMITGHPPFSGDNVLTTMNMHQTEKIPSVGDTVDRKFRDEIDGIIAGMMAKTPEERYASVVDVKADLINLELRIKANGVPAASAGSGPDLGKRQIAWGGLDLKSIMVLVTVATLLVVLGFVLNFRSDPSESRDLAAARADKTSWSASDVKAQKLFDIGSYDEAGSVFRRAYHKALTLPEPRKSRLAAISLREIRILETVRNDKSGIDWANRQLLEFSNTTLKTKVPFDQLKSAISLAIRQGDAKELEIQISDLVLWSSSYTHDGVDVSTYVENLLSRVADESKYYVCALHLRLYKAALDQAASRPVDMRAIDEVLALKPDQLNPSIARLACMTAIADPSYPVGKLERIARFCSTYGTKEDAIEASVALAEIYRQRNLKSAEADVLKNALTTAEKQIDRRYVSLYTILVRLGSFYAQNGLPERALPLLLRAQAILKCEQTASRRGAEGLNYALIDCYIQLRRFKDAESLLASSVKNAKNSYGASSYEHIVFLAKLGRFYRDQSNFEAARDCFDEANSILKTQNKKPLFRDLQAQLDADMSSMKAPK